MNNASNPERMSYLRRQEQQNALSPAEQEELSRHFQHIEAAEAVALRPAREAMQREAQQLEAENAALRELIRRREAAIARLQRTLQETRAEQITIDAELARLVGAGKGANFYARRPPPQPAAALRVNTLTNIRPDDV